ncbi:hypothetical protein C3L33_20197, partial [Rhododendron williamsianum]
MTAPSSNPIEVPKKKCAAYIHDEVYGTMGCGEVRWTEKVNSESIRNRYGTLDLQRFVPGLGQNALKDTSGRRS